MMMVSSKVLLAVLMLLLMTACGPKRSAGKKPVRISPEEIVQLLENQSMECASINGGPCPEGLARLFMINLADPDNSALCTGFLVGPDRIITNHHCLSTAKECDSTYISVYNGGRIESAKCSRIIAALDDGRPLDYKSIDVTVFELERSIGGPAPFAVTEQLPLIGDTLTAWVIDHVDLYNGRITELACPYKSKIDSIEAGSCAAISGNSGSPMVNQFGQVVGVLWGSTTDESVDESTDLEERRARPDFSYATEVKHFIKYIP